MNETKRKRSKLIDSFSINSTIGELWLMGDNGSLLIIISKIQKQGSRESKQIDKILNSKAARIDNDEFALQWEEIKAEMMGNTDRLIKFEECEMFAEEESES